MNNVEMNDTDSIGVREIDITIRYDGMDIPGTAVAVTTEMKRLNANIYESDMVSGGHHTAVYFKCRIALPEDPAQSEARLFDIENMLKKRIYENYISWFKGNVNIGALQMRDIDVKIDRDTLDKPSYFLRGWLTARDRKGLLNDVLIVFAQRALVVYGLRTYTLPETEGKYVIIHFRSKSTKSRRRGDIDHTQNNLIDLDGLSSDLKEKLSVRTGVVSVEVKGSFEEIHTIPQNAYDGIEIE